jgi:hypothetical protein
VAVAPFQSNEKAPACERSLLFVSFCWKYNLPRQARDPPVRNLKAKKICPHQLNLSCTHTLIAAPRACDRNGVSSAIQQNRLADVPRQAQDQRKPKLRDFAKTGQRK